MSKIMKTAVAACVGTIALTCAAIQPAKAADFSAVPQYGAPPVAERYVEERYVYTEPAPAYRPPALVRIAPPVAAYEPAPPAVVVEPEPYYAQRRVYVEPGYRRGFGPYHADYAYERGWGHGHLR